MLGWLVSGIWGGGQELRRWLADFALALCLFWVAAFVVSGSDIRAHAIPLRVLSKQVIRPDVANSSRTSMRGDEIGDPFYDLRAPEAVRVPALALVLLSMAFAALVGRKSRVLAPFASRLCLPAAAQRVEEGLTGQNGSSPSRIPLLHTLTNLRYMITEFSVSREANDGQ